MATELDESPIVFSFRVTAIAKVATLYEVRAPTRVQAENFLRETVEVAEAAWSPVEVDSSSLEFECVGEACPGVTLWEPG